MAKEEEEERLAMEEAERLAAEARIVEEERLKKAIEEAQKREVRILGFNLILFLNQSSFINMTKILLSLNRRKKNAKKRRRNKSVKSPKERPKKRLKENRPSLTRS